jgi:hypothetical protein
MTNNTEPIKAKITVNGQELATVKQFKYLGAIISEEGSKTEILSRAAQTTAALTKLKTNLERQEHQSQIQTEVTPCTGSFHLPVRM